MNRFGFFVAALLTAAAPFAGGPATAELLPLGTELQVNTYTTDTQHGPGQSQVAVAADGSFVVVWQSYEQDGSGHGVIAQRYDADGAAAGVEFIVNVYTTSSQRDPVVGAADDGSFVVVWRSGNIDGSSDAVVGRRFGSDGSGVGGEFLANVYTTGSQRSPAVSVAADGSFVVAWQSYGQDGSGSGVFGRRFDSAANALGVEFQVNTYTTGPQYSPSAGLAGDGSFVVAWEHYSYGGDYFEIRARRFDSSGTGAGSEFPVNTYTTGFQDNPSARAAADGSFVVAWDGAGNEPSGYGIGARRFDSAGTPVGATIQVNTYTTDEQLRPALAVNDDGSFAVAWTSIDQDGSGYGIFARSFDVDGTAVGDELQVNTYTTDSQYRSSVAGDGNGGFVVAWRSYGQDGHYNGMFAQRVCTDADSDGNCDGGTAARCASSPKTGCIEAAVAKMQVSEKKAGKEKMKIGWGKLAEEVVQADFGDPVGTETEVAACIYDDAGALVGDYRVQLGAQQCGDKPCWKAKGTKGYGFKDKVASNDGIDKIQLAGGEAGKGKASVGGKNNADKGATALPTGVVAGLTLEIAPTVQIVAGGGRCITAAINSISKDDGQQYKAARVQ